MEFTVTANLEGRKQADLLVVPFWKEDKHVEAACDLKKLEKLLTLPLSEGDFKGKEGEVLVLYVEGQKEKRIALLGLGEKEKITVEILRRAYASLTKNCNKKKWKTLNLAIPQVTSLSEDSILRGVLEGVLLTNYVFDKLKHDAIKDSPSSLISTLGLITKSKNALEQAKKILTICEGVYLARNLTNANADEITPEYLSKLAQDIAKKHPKVKATIFDKKRIEKEKMGLLLAVNKGSAAEPALIILEYKGTPKAKDHVVLVGKGITYDTGGLNLKSSGMDSMKCDMGGAAVVLATISVVAELGLPIHVTAVVPATENSISDRSYKPGDVYQAMSGKTVEIANTDAEGRLILADALTYVEKYLKPTKIIDFATLTGGVEIALGSEATGLLCNNDALADLLIRASSETFERAWRLPLYEEYKDNLKSDVADIKNVGTRSASTIIGGIFLQYFVNPKTPWAHFDIASTAFLNDSKRYHPKHATGVGVRLMIEFLEHL